MEPIIVWLRRDLRLADNPALSAAARDGRPVPVYIHAAEEEGAWPPGAASRWWLHHSLASLSRDLGRAGSGLIVARGPSADALTALAEATGARRVYWNRLFEPALAARDAAVQAGLARRGIDTAEYPGDLLLPPEAVRTAAGGPYKVFTPFWRFYQRHAPVEAPLPAPMALPPIGTNLRSLELMQLGLLPKVPWDAGLRQCWRPGEGGAQARLAWLMEEGLAPYPQGRDRPAESATSRLSPHLHFGELGPRQVVWAMTQQVSPQVLSGSEALGRQLIWREFACHLLCHFPSLPDQPLDERFRRFPWRRQAHGLLRAWQQGRTGVPWVDAGMRQLWHTGWMHNRVRMAAASFLVKNCRIPWQAGERWFWDTLVDADLANNSLGWQWVAGSGPDAAPYFRVFNPVRQGQRFDPEGRYLRRWLPELAALPDRWLHQPWSAPAPVLARAEIILGRSYPRPVVDLADSRQQALEAFRRSVSGRPRATA